MRPTISLLLLALLGACTTTPTCTTPGETRCDGTRAQVCDARHGWQTVLQCETLRTEPGAAMTCCRSAASGNSTCLLAEHCTGGAP